jgi:hypothetical protein
VLVDAHLATPHPRGSAQQQTRVAGYSRQTYWDVSRSGAVVTFDELCLGCLPIAVLCEPNRPLFGHHDHGVTHSSSYHGSGR